MVEKLQIKWKFGPNLKKNREENNMDNIFYNNFPHFLKQSFNINYLALQFG